MNQYSFLPISEFLFNEKFQQNTSIITHILYVRKPKLTISSFHYINLWPSYIKIWQILKRFTGTYCREQSLKLGGVYKYTIRRQTFVIYKIMCSKTQVSCEKIGST